MNPKRDQFAPDLGVEDETEGSGYDQYFPADAVGRVSLLRNKTGGLSQKEVGMVLIIQTAMEADVEGPSLLTHFGRLSTFAANHHGQQNALTAFAVVTSSVLLDIR